MLAVDVFRLAADWGLAHESAAAFQPGAAPCVWCLRGFAVHHFDRNILSAVSSWIRLDECCHPPPMAGIQSELAEYVIGDE